MHLAEAVGFEPTNELPRYRISRGVKRLNPLISSHKSV